MSKAITLTLSQFAQSLGQHHRITLDVSLVWHKQYVAADAVTRKALREDFIMNFLVGNILPVGKVSSQADVEAAQRKAAKVLAMSRTERSTADQNAYRAAEMKFNYHIRRDAGKNSSQAASAAVSPVDKLLASYAKLTAAQRKSFLAKAAAL